MFLFLWALGYICEERKSGAYVSTVKEKQEKRCWANTVKWKEMGEVGTASLGRKSWRGSAPNRTVSRGRGDTTSLSVCC